MYVFTLGGGCIFPVQPPANYGNPPTEEGETLPSLELIQKGRNAFGEMIYYIRDHNGIINQVHEEHVHDFLKKNGVSELKEGTPYEYPRNTNR